MFEVSAQKHTRLFKFETKGSLLMLFAFYFITLFLFYVKACNSLLIDDGIAGLVKFEEQGYRGFLNSFGFTSLYYFHDFFNLLVYLVAGKSSFGWFSVMITFHSVNVTLNFIVFRKFYSLLEIKNAAGIAFIGSFLFAFSPYQTENVLWAATLHYAIALCIFFVSAGLLLNNLKQGYLETKTTLIVIALFIVALLTLEISLFFPFAYFTLALAIIWSKKTRVSFTQLITRFLIPLLLTIVLYFIATRILKGHWIPHYGETHLQNNTVKNFSTNIARYLFKLLGFIHFTEYQNREMVYTLCERWKRALAIESSIVIFFCFAFFLLRKKTEAKTFICVTLLAFVFLFPVLHMYFMYVFNTENDRLSYFFSVALYQLVPFVLVSLSVYLGILFSAGFAIVGGYFLEQQVNKWHEAGLLQTRCISSFVWMDAPKIYVLNSPTNFAGVYEFRNNMRLPYALRFFKDFKKSEKIIPVLSSNYGSSSDSTVVSVVNDSTLHVAVNGGWLMDEFHGAVDFSNEEITVDVLEGPPAYNVVFHKKITGSVFVYSTGSGFKALSGF